MSEETVVLHLGNGRDLSFDGHPALRLMFEAMAPERAEQAKALVGFLMLTRGMLGANSVKHALRVLIEKGALSRTLTAKYQGGETYSIEELFGDVLQNAPRADICTCRLEGTSVFNPHDSLKTYFEEFMAARSFDNDVEDSELLQVLQTVEMQSPPGLLPTSTSAVEMIAIRNDKTPSADVSVGCSTPNNFYGSPLTIGKFSTSSDESPLPASRKKAKKDHFDSQ